MTKNFVQAMKKKVIEKVRDEKLKRVVREEAPPYISKLRIENSINMIKQ